MVFADWAAFCAFLTSETTPVARTNRLIPMATLIRVRSRRQDGDNMERAFMSRDPAGTKADLIS